MRELDMGIFKAAPELKHIGKFVSEQASHTKPRRPAQTG
jgi:hypothetical protein